MANEMIFDEAYQGDFYVRYPYTEKIFEKKTKYQRVLLIRTVAFGRVLFLDEVLNSAESDEFIYHEGIVHPAMLRAANRASVLVIGGAEGGTIREILKYDDVHDVFMVDIDEELVDLCRRYLSDIYGDPWSDSRLNLIFADGRDFLKKKSRYDVIIIDLNEASEGGPAQKLFTKEFYELVHGALNPGGVVAVQSEWMHTQFHRDLVATQRDVFLDLMTLELNIPSFLISEAINLCSNTKGQLSLSPEKINGIIEDKGLNLKFYNGKVDQKISIQPPYILEQYRRPARIFTDDELPVYYFSETINK